jgi:hypothetical protein
MKTLFNRALSPTPPFFRRLRNIGLLLAAISTAIVTAPIALPSIAITLSGYLTLAGTVISAVSQLAVEEAPKD